ncbi:bifunctional 2',3'-cyclic-nucleotide 2'-phosphodiesterase/3'-nucleotidase [Neobacillus ginsengisoli]|uniref:bifunctional 2',3'-cyclic-nucleotide 2'-phosphodiesterase/3'-nucleotidase n=1 Tax=Neobacillus ginsengisoli TaxID=904295 RepID=UPI0027D89F5F|nr:bifunctional 2',3'-cyclic-nucleotide 2'-phosphodiesterase/3'-nucleotidase [Neobacillus ginsengisoli]
MKRKIKRSIKRRLFNGSIAVALALTIVPMNIFPQTAKAAGTTATAGNTAKLRILETTDLHDAVMAYDYYQDTDKGINYGLSKTATLIQQARSEVDPSNSMLFDAGDLLQGNPMADYVAKVKPLTENDVHPMFKAMKLLKYDAGIVGNHEFNYGLGYLNTALKNAPYPFVNANIYVDDHDGNPNNDKNYFTPYQILDKKFKDKDGVEQTVKVGVIGFAPPQILQWDKDNLEGKVIVKDIVQTANKYIAEMKANGAQVIVAIAHSGCDVTNEGQQDAENAVFSLSKVDGIDALLFGHAHLAFPGGKEFHQVGKVENPDLPGLDNTKGTINGTPAVEAGFWGNNLGVLDLALVQQADGTWKADKAASKSVDMPVTATTAVDDTIVNEVKTEHEATLAYVRGKIGETTAPMNSYFSRVMDDPTIQIVNNAQTDYVKNWIKTNKPDLADIPVISAGAPFKAGRQGAGDYTNIVKGDLSIKSANDLYLYNNTLKAVELTGAEVKEWLEMSASQFNQIDSNNANAQELINYNFQPYNFDVIDGIKYQVDVTQPARYNFLTGDVSNADAHRIIHFTDMKGNPIDPDQKFIVATNNYRASGGGNFPGTRGGKATIVVDSPYENRQILMDYIKDKKVVNPSADNNWKIAPVGGVAKTLTFKSSPAAKDVLTSVPNVKAVAPLADGSGFEQYSLDQNVHVQLLGINDFHGQLDTWRAITDSNKKIIDYSGGIEYLAAYLKQREATNPANTLMVQAGDLVGASPPVSALLQDEPTIRFMNELGFDVGTIGNHEFDEGVTEMKRLIYGGDNPKTSQYEAKYGKFTGSTMNYVVANVVDEKTNEPILPPYAVKEVEGMKIGFIGVVTTETPTIVTPSGTAGVKFTDEVEAINKYSKVLTDQGVKTIVVLAHDPGSSKTDGTGATGKLVDMAKAIDPSVDVIYGAHDHKYLNTTVNGKLLVQSWSYGTAFSDIDLTIDPVTQDIINEKAEVVDTLHSKITPDATIKKELDGYQEDIKPVVSKVVGATSAPITNVANDSGESALGNLIADGMRAVTGTQLGFMNSGGIRNPLPQGTITWGDLFKVQPFGNDLVTMTITGDQIRTLLNQQFQAPPSYNKIMAISGLRYTWNDNKPYGSKVLDIYLDNGTPINPTADYTITVNNFMADGGDGFTILKSGKNRVTNVVDLDGFIQYFSSLKQPVSAKIEGRIIQDSKVDQPEVEVTDRDDYVYGTTEPFAKVVAKVGEQVLGQVTADKDGYFEIDMNKTYAKGTVITLTITDKAGNTKSFDIQVVVETGWIWVDNEEGNGVWKYVDPKTEAFITNKWLHDDDGYWYYFNKEGIMQTGWVKVDGKWYHLDEDGAMQTGWFKEGKKWYYLDLKNGDMKIGWVSNKNKWYYLVASGEMKASSWVKSGTKWYYMNAAGEMTTNTWVKTGNKWYFLGATGEMKTGWVQVGNKWYFLYNDGSMAANTVIGKYKLGKDGTWVK